MITTGTRSGLQKIRRTSTREAAIEAVRRYILDNHLQPGDSLPIEQAFCQGLGISRNIIREALFYFRAAGIVESRTKTGAIVRRLFPEDPFQSFLPFLAADPGSRREAAQMRQALECGAAPFILANLTAADVEIFDGLLEWLHEPFRRKAFEIEFHSRLLRLSRNRLIESLIPLTVEFFSADSSACTPTVLARVRKDHQRIVSALRANDLAAFEGAIKNHYKPYRGEAL